MYKLFITNSKTERRLQEYCQQRKSIQEKLEKLKNSPRTELGAHPLHGRLKGKWACWLGSNIRIVYTIDDEKEIIIIEAVGSHKIY